MMITSVIKTVLLIIIILIIGYFSYNESKCQNNAYGLKVEGRYNIFKGCEMNISASGVDDWIKYQDKRE